MVLSLINSVVSLAVSACRAVWFGVADVAFYFVLIADLPERRKEEEKEENFQHRHAAGAEKKQEGDGVRAETRQGERRDVRTREATEDQPAGSGGTRTDVGVDFLKCTILRC